MLPWLLLAAAAAVAAPVIENGATPANGLRTIELQEQWRIGGMDDEENLLGLVREAAMDEEGNVYLLDTQLVTVLVYDADGQFVAELGRDGDGPGEFRRPRDLILLPDGTVGVVQGFPGSIVKITRDGMPAGRIELAGDPTEGGFFALRKVLANGDGLVFAGSHITREETKRTSLTQIVRSGLDGSPVATYYGFSYVRDFTDNRRDETTDYFPPTWAVGPDGQVWVPPLRNAYRFDVYDRDGTLVRTVERDYESWQRTADELEMTRTWMTPWGRGRNRDWEIVVEPTARDISQCHADEAGRLWVMSSRGSHPDQEGIHSRWDVFDPDGRFAEQIDLACEGDALADAIRYVGDGTFVLIRNSLDAALAARGEAGEEVIDEEAEPVEVIVYRMP